MPLWLSLRVAGDWCKCFSNCHFKWPQHLSGQKKQTRNLIAPRGGHVWKHVWPPFSQWLHCYLVAVENLTPNSCSGSLQIPIHLSRSSLYSVSLLIYNPASLTKMSYNTVISMLWYSTECWHVIWGWNFIDNLNLSIIHNYTTYLNYCGH